MKRAQLLSLLGCCLTLSAAHAQTQTSYYNPTQPIDTTTAVSDTVRASTLYGKSLLVIGDSYVRNHRHPIEETWHYRLAQRYHMSYYNYGKNGNCVAFDCTKRGFGIPMYQRLEELPEAMDYVLVIAGHNDAVMIGTPDTTCTAEADVARHDSLLNEFRLRLGQLIESLSARYPEAHIAFVSPWDVDYPGFAEMQHVLTEVCAAHSIPLYDAAHQSGILVRDADFRRRYFQRANDTAHLNAAGHALFLSRAEAFMLGL
jgi:lysophospholipase L1-like esterase